MRKFLLQGLRSRPLTETPPQPEGAAIEELGRSLEARLRRRLGRSLAIRAVDAGSCNGCELELQALSNPFHDLERFGLHFVASPRHADVLMVTGPVSRNMAEALARTHAAAPEPKWVIAVGDWLLQGLLRHPRRGLGGHSGRPPHPRLPAHANRAFAGPHRASRRRRDARVTIPLPS
jgi:hypothetical protein